MLGLAEHRCGATDLGPRVDEVDRIEGAAAVLALVAPGLRVLAVRADPLDVAIGQEALILLVEVLLADPAVDVALLEQPEEHVLGDRSVIGGAGRGVQVPTDPDPLPALDDLGVVAIDDLLRRHPLGVGPHGDGRAVHIAPADHQHVVAGQPVIAGEDVGRQVGPGEVPEMA